jgi:hypothetical protein
LRSEIQRQIGSIRPYLEAPVSGIRKLMPAPARKPGPASVITRILLVQYVLQHRCGRVQAEFTSTTLGSRPAPGTPSAKRSVGTHREQPACRTRCPKEPHAQRSWHLQRSPPAQSEDLPPEVWLPTLSVPTTSGSSTVRRAIAAACSSTSVGGRNSKHVAEVGGRHCRRTSGPHTC